MKTNAPSKSLKPSRTLAEPYDKARGLSGLYVTTVWPARIAGTPPPTVRLLNVFVSEWLVQGIVRAKRLVFKKERLPKCEVTRVGLRVSQSGGKYREKYP